MIEHDYKELFGNDSIDKQLVITTDDGMVTITNTELHNEAFELTESISDDDSLVFGNVSAALLKFTVSNIFTDLKNKWITVKTYLNHDDSNSFQIGRYKVYSDIPTADRKKREIKAYDALYDVLNADVSAWYNTIFPKTSSTVTLKQFRDSFFSHFGIGQEEITLVNDGMVVTKTIQPEELSGKVVLSAICEINGCFGHIGRNGKFKYVYLEPITEGLYPSETLYPTENLFPSEPNTETLKTGSYISANYEDYLVEKINKIEIRQEEDNVGAVIGDGNNAYVIQDNFLVYGKSASQLNTIGNNILDKIGGIYYRPFTAKAKGNPCLEVGDGISLSTKYIAIHSYILNRTLSGIQALRDEYTAEGTQYQPTKVNSVNRSIQQLKGKTNELTRTVEETRLEMEDLDKELRSTISATASEIRLEVENLSTETSASIRTLSNRISLKVDSDDVESMIEVALDEIVITSKQIRLEGYTTINEKLEITEDGKLVLYGDTGFKATMSEQGISVSGETLDTVSNYQSNGITHRHGTSTFRLSNVTSNGITIGYSNRPIVNIFVESINGSTPITDDNIDDYIPSKYVTSSELSTELEDYVTLSKYNSGFNSLNSGLAYLESRIEALESKIE